MARWMSSRGVGAALFAQSLFSVVPKLTAATIDHLDRL